MTTKLYYLQELFGTFLEPFDIIDLFQETGIFKNAGIRIRKTEGMDDQARRERVRIFLAWFESYEPVDGNKHQELEDALSQAGGYEWLMPLLKEHEIFDEKMIQRLDRLQKPDKVKKIFGVIFPALKDVNARDVTDQMHSFLGDRDREEILKVIEHRANQDALSVLLWKLIYKPPEWVDTFICAIEKLNYNATNLMLSDTRYSTLAEALRDLFGYWDYEAAVETMDIDESPEPMLGETMYQSRHNPEYSLGRSDLLPVKKIVETADAEVGCCTHIDEKMNIKEELPDELEEKLRGYQKELSKLAVTGDAPSVVICERTGSGKTIVAAYIIDQHLKCNTDGKVAFFCPNGGLAEQQHGKMSDYMPERSQAKAISVMRGSMENEISKDFSRLIASSEVVVMTPQMLLNHIQKHGKQVLFYFTMMVFDECHHARASHPYCEILKKYHEEMKNNNQKGKNRGEQKRIQIIGLTATLGIGSATTDEEAQDNIFKLLGILDAKGGIVTVREDKNIDELNENCPGAAEDTIFINADDDAHDDPFRDVLKEAAHNIILFLHEMRVFDRLNVQGPVGHIGGLKKEFEGWCQKLRIAAEAHIDGETKMDEEVKACTLGRDTKSCAETLLRLKRAYDLCHNCQPSNAIQEIRRFVEKRYEEHQEKNTEIENNIHQALNLLIEKQMKVVEDAENKMLVIIEDKIKRKQEQDPNFRCMIMVSRRLYAAYLEKWVEESEVLKQLGAKRYIGIGSTSQSEFPGMTHKKQSEALHGFDKGFYRVLVCTPDAAGEGIDIALCNLVIAVDCVKDEVKRIQLGGRTRKENSEVVYIYFNSDGAKWDSLPITKQLLMKKVTRGIIKMHDQHPEEFLMKLIKGKNQVTGELAAAAEKKRNAPTAVSGRRDSFLCRGCSIDICCTDQIIKLNKSHHTVNDVNFKDKYNRSRHDLRGEFCGTTSMRHVNRIQCANCKCEWGNEVAWKKYLIPIIGIRGFKIRDVRGKVHLPSKWKNTRLRIPECSNDNNLFDKLFEKYESAE